MSAGPVPVDADSRAELAEVFLSDRTCLWESAEGCEFMPGVLIRYPGAKTTDVLVRISRDEDFDSRGGAVAR